MLNVNMNNGFYPALGTPTDNRGLIIKDSFCKGVELMVGAGAAGVLCMGSMGKMATIKNSEYPKAAKYCVDVVSKRIPVMVGVMDCSVSRVLDRIEALGDIDIQGVVATVPYYSKVSNDGILNFFNSVSRASKYPVYVYDLPSVTQCPVSGDVLKKLIDMPNIKGVKTANLDMILDMQRNNKFNDGFSAFYSGLDLFDVAIKSGVGKNLDGMFTCTPHNSRKMYLEAEEQNFDEVSTCLNNILTLRNLFIKGGVLPSYSYAMELLGCPGNYHADYETLVSETIKEQISDYMKSINEI